MPFWSPPSTTTTRPGARLMAENGRTGLESGPQPHIIASPPGTGAPIDRINYTPDTGEVHPPGVLAPIDKLNYSLVPHDDLNYSGQLGQTSSPPGQGQAQQGGGAAGLGMSSALQPGQGQALQSNVWKNTGQPGAGAESIVNSPGTPAGTDGLTGRYGENATLRTNAFSPGQPPLSPNPYGTGPGPQMQASGPTVRPMDQRASMTGNLGNWGTGAGADDDGDGYDDETGEPVSPEDAIYGSSGSSTPSGGGGTASDGGGGSATPGESQAPTSAPAGYHFRLDPPNGADGQPPRAPGGMPVRQTLWMDPDQPGKANIPLGYYDAQYKAGTSERPYIKFTEKEQRSQSPDYAKELDAGAKTSGGRQIIEQVGSDGQMHRVLVDRDHPDQGVLTDYGPSQLPKTATPGQQGNEKIYGQESAHPTVLVQGADGKWTHDAAREAQMAKDFAAKQQQDVDKTAAANQARIDAAQIGSTPYAVHQDSAGQSWIVNEQTGETEKLGVVDPKQGVYESNGRLLKLGADGKSATELYKPPPGYDIHYDSYGRAIAVNKDDPSKTSTVYTPEDYEDRKALDKQKALADIEKTKSDLATSKITQTDSRMKMMDALQKLEHPEARFIGSSDIYLPSGSAADVQRYNPETKTSTYEHVSGGDLSPEQKANAARMHSMLDELDKAMAGGDTNKANAIATQVQQSQTQPTQTQQPQQQTDQPGLLNLDAIQAQAAASPAGAVMKPGWPGEDPRLTGAAQPPTSRTTAAGDIAHYDQFGVLTGIDYRNTAPPGYEGLGSTLSEGLDSDQGQTDESQDQGDEYGQEDPNEVIWDPAVGRRRRRGDITGAGTDIPQGGQGNPKPAGRPGYDTTPTPNPIPPSSPPPGGPMGGGPPTSPPMAGAPPSAAGGANPAELAQQPGYNPLNPPDLAALGPPGGGGGTAPGIQPGAMPNTMPGGQPGAPPNLNDPLFQFALQRRQSAQQPQMGGGQDEPAQPNGSSFAGWTPPVPQEDVAGIGHRFGQQMNVGEPQHSGVDLQAVEGTPTIAPVDGVVQRVEYNPQGLGITVVLQGKDGTIHKLGHLKKTDAYPGLTVSQGQDLQSQVGSTGNTTGSHLHWAVKTPDGQPTDPTASLGAMANMPPVPGTQMMGPPGGTGGVQSQRGPIMSGAAGPGPLAVPPAQGAPPPPAAQPASSPPQQPPMGQGAGQATADPSEPTNTDSQDWREWMIAHGLMAPTPSTGVYSADPNEPEDPNSPGFRQRVGSGADLVDEPPDPNWIAKLRAEQAAARQARLTARSDPWAPTGKASEVPTPAPNDDEESTWWQEDEDKPRVYEPGQGMAGRGTSQGRVQGSEVGGRYQRSQETNPQSRAEQEGRRPRSSVSKLSGDRPYNPESPYQLEAWNPHDKDTDPKSWTSWDRQHKWYLRNRAETGETVPTGQDRPTDWRAQLDNLTNQGWPQEAVDEMKAIGRQPTRDEIEAIRTKYKNLPTGEADTGKVDATDWEAEWERKRAAGEPTTPAPGEGANAQPGWEPKGVTNPTPAPDKTGIPPQVQRRLDQMSPTGPGKPFFETPEEEQEVQDMVRRDTAKGFGQQPSGPQDPGPDPFAGRSYTDMSKAEVEQANQWAHDKVAWREWAKENDPAALEKEEPGWDPQAHEDAVKRGDTDAILRSLQQQGYTQEDLDKSNPYTQGMGDVFPPDKGVSKSVSPPIDLKGGHAPPVGPDPRDLIGKPGINVLPGPLTGGHMPGPEIQMPGGHMPGPEIKLPDVTDKLPDWWPGKSEPGNPIVTPPPEVTGPTDQGTPESYSDMLERLRQLGQGAGADDGEDQQIAAMLGISPDQITDEIRQWWDSRPQPGASPDQGDAGMGAGLQLGPVHLSTSMRQPMRMPSSRMNMSRRAGWTPRTGGIARRPPMGTSAMLSI